MLQSEGNMSLKNPVTPLGIDPETVQLAAQRLNHYTTSGPNQEYNILLLLLLLLLILLLLFSFFVISR
jgi:hypothetical protein